jgi:hypothetical protein
VSKGTLYVAVLAATVLISGPARAQDPKPKDAAKEKDKGAKAKPPARSYSDDDLKKYKEKPPEDGASAQPASSAGESGAGDAPVPGQRRSREYGGYQKLPPPVAPAPIAPGPTGTAPAAPEPSASDSTAGAEDTRSPEEVEWRRRAAQARRPIQEADGRIKQIESQIADLRDQLNPMSTKYVLGGNSTAGAGAVYEVEEQLRNLDSQLVDARTVAADAQKGWQAFLEEARQGGASAAWLNP